MAARRSALCDVWRENETTYEMMETFIVGYGHHWIRFGHGRVAEAPIGQRLLAKATDTFLAACSMHRSLKIFPKDQLSIYGHTFTLDGDAILWRL